MANRTDISTEYRNCKIEPILVVRFAVKHPRWEPSVLTARGAFRNETAIAAQNRLEAETPTRPAFNTVSWVAQRNQFQLGGARSTKGECSCR
jgi:hypothetical protein